MFKTDQSLYSVLYPNSCQNLITSPSSFHLLTLSIQLVLWRAIQGTDFNSDSLVHSCVSQKTFLAARIIILNYSTAGTSCLSNKPRGSSRKHKFSTHKDLLIAIRPSTSFKHRSCSIPRLLLQPCFQVSSMSASFWNRLNKMLYAYRYIINTE